MWMHAVTLKDGTRIHAYKHWHTRRYLHLSDDGRHLGRPHFHASYGEDEASIEIESLEILAGRMPRRARSLVTQWASAHRVQLRDNWTRARESQPLAPIDPLQ
jgi:uncharacterized protein DUF4160